MLKANEIQEPGAYWYRDDSGAEPALVLVWAEGLARDDWEVSWFGRQDNDRLEDLPGVVHGPLRAPPVAGD